MSSQLVLIVDDEPDLCELIEITLQRMGVASNSAGSIAEASALLARNRYDLCLTDMRLPDGNGIELVKTINSDFPDLPVAMITAHGNVESAVQALKSGAFDFVSKPVDLQHLRNMVESALKLKAVPQVKEKNGAKPGLTLLGESSVIRSTRATIAKLAKSQAPVYIAGESGSGKELVARMIHAQGARSEGAFVPVNCGAIPESLMESEFFGHKKGSFTGATTDKEGLFQAAHGGTLFLDEVADLPMSMQVKLLRAIQEKAIRSVGSQKEIPINVRILSATHKDLAHLVKEGKFRQDLFYRINVIELHVPALREHPKDIPLLARHILNTLEGGEHAHVELSQEAMACLQHYRFPGNVRELENILQRALTLCEENIINPNDLQLPVPDSSDLVATEHSNLPLDSHLDTIEKQAIQEALEKTRYNKTAAAKLLGISFRQLRYRLKKMDMD